MLRTLQYRLARAEEALGVLINRYNGHIDRGDQDHLAAVASELESEAPTRADEIAAAGNYVRSGGEAGPGPHQE